LTKEHFYAVLKMLVTCFRLTAGGLATDYDVLIGQKSMGMFLEKEGFAALPGPTVPTPGELFDLIFFNSRTNGLKPVFMRPQG
jgi:hypothetical protein